MANTVKMRRSSVASKVPTTSDILLGELAVNTYDGKLFIKKSTTGSETGEGVSVVEIGASSADYTITTTAVDKTLVNRERCTVTESGKTITLPASPSAGWEVTVTIGGTFTNTVIARNSSNIMSLAEDMTIDRPYISVTLYYVDATRGWRII